MKLTYMLSPTTSYIIHTAASNVLSENLINDKRIDVKFDYTITTIFSNVKKMKEQGLVSFSNDTSPVSTFCKESASIERTYSVLKSYSTGFFERVVNNIETTIVLVTCWNSFSLPFIKTLLENDKKVVIGGVLCNSYSYEHIRSSLVSIGVKNDLLENLIIVKGYVDLTTDLYKIITDWKDTIITQNDFSTIWKCKSDYIKNRLAVVKKFRFRPFWYTVVFDNGCWYKKCTFCNIDRIKQINFIKDISVDDLYNNLILNLKQYRTNNLFINDPYFTFDDKKRELLKRLRESNIEIAILTGISLLRNKAYLNDIKEYITELRIGLESCSDFALSYINKGYNWSDILESINLTTTTLPPSITVRYLYIMDLAENSRESVLQNYNRLISVRDIFRDRGFDFYFFPRNLHMFKDIDIEKTTKYIRLSDNSTNVSGIWRIYNFLESHGFEINVPKDIVLPYERYDDSGDILPSDYDIITDNMMIKLVS